MDQPVPWKLDQKSLNIEEALKDFTTWFYCCWGFFADVKIQQILKASLLAIPNHFPQNQCWISTQWLSLFLDQKAKGEVGLYKVCHSLHTGVVNWEQDVPALGAARSKGKHQTGRTQSARTLAPASLVGPCIPVGCEKATGTHQQPSGLSSSYQMGLWVHCEVIYQPKKS